MIKKGQYTAVWDLGKISTAAELDTDTNKIKANHVKCGDLGSLIEESFESKGETFNICGNCHQTILINNRCPDENCESNQ